MRNVYPHAEFGGLLRQARKQLGMIQTEAARSIGIATTYYGRVERGDNRCSLPVFAAMHRVLQFDANQLLMALGETSELISAPSRRLPRTPHDASGPHEMFARALRPARLKKRLTQTMVADAIGSKEMFYQRIESGHARPSLAMFARLHHCLEFDANRLLEAFEQKTRKKPPYARLGAFLAYSRNLAHISITAAAETVGCPLDEYAGIETGQRLPTLAELVALHRLIGFSADTALRRIPGE